MCVLECILEKFPYKKTALFFSVERKVVKFRNFKGLFSFFGFRYLVFWARFLERWSSLTHGRIQVFFRRGRTRLLLYFNTNKPHSFFLQNTSCIRKPQVISRRGGGVRTPAPSPYIRPRNPSLSQILSTVFLSKNM